MYIYIYNICNLSGTNLYMYIYKLVPSPTFKTESTPLPVLVEDFRCRRLDKGCVDVRTPLIIRSTVQLGSSL